MFIDLVDHLRCPQAHEESWLVVAVERMAGRYIQQGSLGCPVCRARFPIRDFVAQFTNEPGGVAGGGWFLTTHPDSLTRLAALCGLTQGGGFVALTPHWASLAAPLALTYDVQCVVVDPAGTATPGDGVSVLHVAAPVPLAAGALRALALGGEREALVPSLVRAVRAGGRVLAPAMHPVPDGVREIARDEREWVGERSAGESPLVTLVRGSAP